MASNLSKRLNRLERLAGELLNQTQGPVYVRGDAPVPEGEFVRIVREYVKPPQRDEVDLPPVEPSGMICLALTRSGQRTSIGCLPTPISGWRS